ncbi:MAG: DEAD/DEAH box helicase, partial [Alicyclobacillaceae bacterium]|nr:DEAD/DEAH box helicase [Alicyclobacillaceae bacterium]
MKDELRADREIAQRLDRTWSAFFAQFGRLTPVQRAAIPAILAGRDVLICSATASGKTEAACAPLVERNIRQRIPWTILYISPTRALINDLFERLQPPLSRLGLCLRRRTGDHRVTLTQIPHILLTTPESFDSLLCRGRLEEPMGHVLAHVVAVVLDEVHLFYNSARGEQVRWLIYRLKRLRHQALIRGWAKSETVQIVALSATLADPQRVLQRFLPGGEVISVGGQRELEVVNMGDGLGSVEEVLPIYVDQLSKSEKILVFSNTRKRADQLAIRLKSPLQKHGYRVFVHHGKIAPRMRKLAEDTLKKEGR